MRRQEAAERRESGPEIKFGMRWIFSLYFPLLQGMVISRTSSVVLSNISRGLRGGGKTWPPQLHSHFSFSHFALGTL